MATTVANTFKQLGEDEGMVDSENIFKDRKMA
jgi:hypothetical protein